MANKHSLFALAALAAAAPLWASQPQAVPQTGAPPASPTARYCLRVDPVIGSRIETVRCETREGWASLDVDLDKEWPAWGVRVVTGTPPNG